MCDLETKFRHLEIFPGVLLPLTYDVRTAVVAAAVEGNDRDVRRTLETFIADGLWSYLADLLNKPADEDVFELGQSLREARAVHLGLPADTPFEEVLATERKLNRCLTIGELRRERDKRNGTYVPLVNGEW